MDGTHDSPIKAFLKKHSPIKSRNKPLPQAPKDDGSPTKSRAPMRNLSANVSPTKDNKGAKRKFSGFMRGKQIVSEEPAPPSKHRRVASVPGKAPAPQHDPMPPARNEDGSLVDRVQQLEAQLQAAKAQLAGGSLSPRKAMSPRRIRPAAARRSHSYEVHTDFDQDAAARQDRLLRGARYDGLVESLLERDYESANARAASYSSRHGAATNRHGISESGRHSALASYGDMESGYMDDEEDKAEHLRRKRSELRAAEWRKIQEKYDHSPQRAASSGTKRSRDTISSVAEGPPARRQKQSQELSRDKSLPQLPQHGRRSASESHAPSARELKRSSITPIQSQPYKIEYVRARPRTPEDTKAQAPSRSPPKGRPTYDLMKAFGSNTPNEKGKAKTNENVETFGGEEDEPEEAAAQPKNVSPHRRNIPSPSRLQTVSEEFEWDDEVF